MNSQTVQLPAGGLTLGETDRLLDCSRTRLTTEVYDVLQYVEESNEEVQEKPGIRCEFFLHHCLRQLLQDVHREVERRT